MVLTALAFGLMWASAGDEAGEKDSIELRLVAIEARLTAIEARLSRIEGESSPLGRSESETSGVTANWKDPTQWRANLRRGLTLEAVRQLFGGRIPVFRAPLTGTLVG